REGSENTSVVVLDRARGVTDMVDLQGGAVEFKTKTSKVVEEWTDRYGAGCEQGGGKASPPPATSLHNVGVMAPFKRNLRNLWFLEEQIVGDNEDPFSPTARQKPMAINVMY
ncbi:hypothetical protein DYB25_008871, partial [Aphanomyces astaci]